MVEKIDSDHVLLVSINCDSKSLPRFASVLWTLNLPEISLLQAKIWVACQGFSFTEAYSLFIRHAVNLSGSMPPCLPAYAEGQYPTVDWLFLDLNSYFASVEQQDRSELRGRPVGIVSVDTDSTCCLAASYEAKAYGIKTGTSVKDAKTLCPHINIVVSRPKLYVEYQQKIIHAIDEHLPIHKVWSVDEVACQLMGRERFLPNATTLGYRIKQSLRNVGLALRCSIGLAPNSYLAKTAADLCKPDGLTIVLKEDLPYALHCMKLQNVVGISSAMERRLNNRGVTTVEQLCKLSSQQMRDIWGSVLGETMWYWLHGEDWKEKPDSERKTLGKQHVLAPKYRTKDAAYKVALKLLSNAAAKLRRLDMWASGIGATVRFTHWGKAVKDETIPPDGALTAAFPPTATP